MNAIAPLLLLCCLYLACAPQALVLRPDAHLHLGPAQRTATLPPPTKGNTLVAAIDLAAPGFLRLEGLPAGSAWLGRSAYTQKANGLGLGPTPIAVTAQTWYLYCATLPAPPPVLTYLPPWADVEDGLAQLAADPSTQRQDLLQLRAALAPHRRRYFQATQALDEELRQRHATAELDMVLQEKALQEKALQDQAAHDQNPLQQTTLTQAADLLAAAGSRIDSLPPERQAPLRRRLDEAAAVVADRRLAQALYTETAAQLLAYCPSSAVVRPGRPPQSDELCQILELLHADELLEEAAGTLMRDAPRAAALTDSAAALLKRRSAAPGPLVWERVQQTLSQARRGDLLARAVVLSHADLAQRIRHHAQFNPQVDAARSAQKRFFDLSRQALQQAEAEAFVAALSLGRDALQQGRHAVDQWTQIGRQLSTAAVEEELVVLRNDTTLFAQRMADWDGLIAYRDRIDRWNGTLQQASAQTDPQTALPHYQALSDLIAALRQTAPPPGFSGTDIDLLLQQARDEQARLGLLALQSTAADDYGRLSYDEAVQRYRLAGELFGSGTPLPAAIATDLKETRTALLRRAIDQARGQIDRALQARQWRQADQWADKVAAWAPSAAHPLRARIAVQRARHLRDRAQKDLERAFVADALLYYEEALEVIAPYADEADAGEIADFLRLEIDNLRRQNLALVRLETAPLPLERCLGPGQPLPRQLPFTLIIRPGLIALPQREGDLVRAYDVELIMPRQDYERLTLKAVTADKASPIPTEFTDLLDGRISLLLRTADFAEAPRIQLTLSGGQVDLASIGRRWYIHKGIRL